MPISYMLPMTSKSMRRMYSDSTLVSEPSMLREAVSTRRLFIAFENTEMSDRLFRACNTTHIVNMYKQFTIIPSLLAMTMESMAILSSSLTLASQLSMPWETPSTSRLSNALASAVMSVRLFRACNMINSDEMCEHFRLLPSFRVVWLSMIKESRWRFSITSVSVNEQSMRWESLCVRRLIFASKYACLQVRLFRACKEKVKESRWRFSITSVSLNKQSMRWESLCVRRLFIAFKYACLSVRLFRACKEILNSCNNNSFQLIQKMYDFKVSSMFILDVNFEAHVCLFMYIFYNVK